MRVLGVADGNDARHVARDLNAVADSVAARAAGEEVARLRPEVIAAARANLAFGYRVTGYAATGLGIRQFLDIGAGLPAPGPTHETAQKINATCRVVYVDYDPLVLAHGRALMTAGPAPGRALGCTATCATPGG